MGKLTGINYYTAGAYYKFRLYNSSKRFSGPPLLIYTMGKVGSQTVRDTLKSKKIDMPLYHLHHLKHDYIVAREKRDKKYFRHRDLQYIWMLQYLRRKLDKGLNNKKWKIVTLIRDPIAVNVSSFFHHVNHVEFLGTQQGYRIKSRYYDFETTVKIQEAGILLKIFLEKVDHDSPVSFFDEEIKKVFGIDVYASDFIKSQGYKIYNGELADVLLIKMNNLNDCANEAFKEFLDLDQVDLVHTNLGSKKPYAPIYQAFKDRVILPDSYINKIYNSKFTQHFFSEEEINVFKETWCTSKNVEIG